MKQVGSSDFELLVMIHQSDRRLPRFDPSPTGALLVRPLLCTPKIMVSASFAQYRSLPFAFRVVGITFQPFLDSCHAT
jgi:hypothetical protein